MSSPSEVLAHVRATHRSAVLDHLASINLPIWSRIVLPIVAVLGTMLLLSTCIPPLRRLVRHTTKVLLNGKRPIRWLAGLLFGMAPPLVWTLAFKQARRIPDEIRPEIHTTVLPVIETFLLSPLGIFLSMALMAPLALMVWIHYQSTHPNQATLYAATILTFAPTLRILNDLAIGLDPSPMQDVSAWLFYGVLHFASPFLAGWWIWFFGAPGAANVFGWCLGCQNLTGLLLHLFNPHAAPWFHDVYPAGTVPDYSFPGNAAGLVRVDHVLGTHLYSDGFRKGPVVFGAIPSLHAATAACCSLFVARYGGFCGASVMMVYFTCMCWSTMYFHHHWAIDLHAGLALALFFFGLVAYGPLRAIDSVHVNQGTTRGIDRLCNWGSPTYSRFCLSDLPLVVSDHKEVRSANDHQELHMVQLVPRSSSASSPGSSSLSYGRRASPSSQPFPSSSSYPIRPPSSSSISRFTKRRASSPPPVPPTPCNVVRSPSSCYSSEEDPSFSRSTSPASGIQTPSESNASQTSRLSLAPPPTRP